ncbi:MAG TPA: GNAT family N-acetyltransferase [Jatrophihabitantaceae bacterium]|nr:GNAT family N-acetyltransferase [Jatrophihabitantaceae bacterium]
MTSEQLVVHDADLPGMDPVTLYRVLALRVDVFVVEQNCVYRELDGREVDPTTRLLWIERDSEVLATLRLLRAADGSARIGRVATAMSARGQGLAAVLMHRALELTADVVVELHAQTYLVAWYERFGFTRAGADFLDDGILHTPMRRGR